MKSCSVMACPQPAEETIDAVVREGARTRLMVLVPVCREHARLDIHKEVSHA